METGDHTLVIRSERVVTPDATVAADIVVAEGRIAAILPCGTAKGRRVIDAMTRLVLPGIVDSHVHVRDPGQTHKEDFDSASAAAAASGVTTIMCMPNTDPVLADKAAFLATREAAQRSRVDFALQALAHPRSLASVSELARLGVVSFEMFLAGAPDMVTGERRDQMAVMRAVAQAGGILGLYPGDPAAVKELNDDEPADADVISRRYPALLEAGALLPALALAAEAKCRVHFRQMSCELSLTVARCARQRGLSGLLTTEVTPHYLALTREHLRRYGPEGHIMPPLREARDVDALWAGLVAGDVDAIGSDHAPHHSDEKARGNGDLSKCPPGFPGLETFLPVVLTEMRRRGIGEGAFARLAATNPARLFGLFPRKGAIVRGADADVVIVDDSSEWTVRSSTFRSKARYSPFEGYKAGARAAMTLIRGEVVYEEGELTGKPGYGQLVRPNVQALSSGANP